MVQDPHPRVPGSTVMAESGTFYPARAFPAPDTPPPRAPRHRLALGPDSDRS